ncbi:MAG TPA: AlpA family phage regulatory protein [Terriglobales bacterium]
MSVLLHRCLHDDLCRDQRAPNAAERKRLAAHLSEIGELLATHGPVGAMAALSAPKPDRMMKIDEVLHLAGASYATLWRWERAGKFPRRKKLGVRSVGWSESEIRAWLAGRC